MTTCQKNKKLGMLLPDTHWQHHILSTRNSIYESNRSDPTPESGPRSHDMTVIYHNGPRVTAYCHHGRYKPLPMSDSVASYYSSSPPHNVFVCCFPASASCSVRSSIIGEFTSHIQIMDDIPRRLLFGRRLCHVSERKGWFDQSTRREHC